MSRLSLQREQNTAQWQRKAPLGKGVRAHSMFYILLLPALLMIIVFSYIPMGGIILAFKQYQFNRPSALGAGRCAHPAVLRADDEHEMGGAEMV
ncbi:MAG TPA: hypothetical protein GX722_05010 [Clostridiales bacterium]|jgi:ABC-type sugar transport system permease subunit|nr:hypothetical protein [Clostridiales bacterium]